MSETNSSQDCDVLILGGGMSGMVAAISAQERGARVMIVEKSHGLGGSMALSNGLIWTFRDKAQLRQDIPHGDEALQDLIVEELAAGIKWLLELGVVLEPEKTFQWYGWGRRSNSAQMIPVLEERIRSGGGQIVFGCAMDSLVIEDGRVKGAVVNDDNGSRTIRAGATVIATGGFQGNPELVTRYITPNAHAMYLRSNPFSTGDGFLAGIAAGAATSELLNSFYGHAMAAAPARFNQLEFQTISQKYGWQAVAINLDGERFTDETQGTGEEDLNFWISHQREASAVLVVDQAIANLEWPDNPPARAAIGRARSAGAPVIDADTIEQLAKKIAEWGIPEDRALATFRGYNAGIEKDGGATLRPPRRKRAMPLATGPFTAVKVTAAITYTGGGLKVDLDMGVVRRSRSVSSFRHLRAPASDMALETIPGLFASGCDVGGVSNWGYMGGLSHALVTGRNAGWSAAEAGKTAS